MKYQVKKQIAYDLTVLGIGACKTNFNLSEGVTTEYVNPANMVWSYTEDPNFEDLYYVGEVKNLSLSEVKRQFPNLTNSELEEIQKYPGQEKQVMDYFKNNPEAQQQLSGPIFEDKIIDFILELAKTEDKLVSIEDLYKQEDLDLNKEAEKAKKSNKTVTKKKVIKPIEKEKKKINK